jgi:hypothetical protein
VNRGAEITVSLGQDLAFENMLAHGNDGFGGCADMLLEGQNQLFRQWRGAYRLLSGFTLMGIEMKPSVECPSLGKKFTKQHF